VSLFLLKWFEERPSCQFAFALGAFVVGIGVGLSWAPSFALDWIAILAGFGIVGACFLRHVDRRISLLVLSCFILGLWRSSTVTVPMVPVDGGMHLFQGSVRGELSATDRGSRVTVGEIRQDEVEVDGQVLVWLDGTPTLEDGDTLTFACRLTRPEPFEGFAYDRYLAVRGITALCYRPVRITTETREHPTVIASLLRIKRALVSRLELALPEPYASFTSGLLFGGDAGLSEGTREAFARTGTSHILAASGFNVSLFSLVFLGWVTRTSLGRRKGIVVTALLVGAFVICAGATAAVVRAAVMAWLALLGLYLRREPSVSVAILLSAALLLLANPLLLRDDIGFQLSFAATIGVLFVAPRWKESWTFVPDIPGWRETIAGTVSAILLTLPLTLWHFGTFSLSAPFVNILILPFVPLLMVAALSALLVASVVPAFGSIAAIPAWMIASLILHIVVLFSALPEASISLPAAHATAVITAILMLGAFLWNTRRTLS
jgi:competence protein ComEC